MLSAVVSQPRPSPLLLGCCFGAAEPACQSLWWFLRLRGHELTQSVVHSASISPLSAALLMLRAISSRKFSRRWWNSICINKVWWHFIQFQLTSIIIFIIIIIIILILIFIVWINGFGRFFFQKIQLFEYQIRSFFKIFKRNYSFCWIKSNIIMINIVNITEKFIFIN